MFGWLDGGMFGWLDGWLAGWLATLEWRKGVRQDAKEGVGIGPGQGRARAGTLGSATTLWRDTIHTINERQ